MAGDDQKVIEPPESLPPGIRTLLKNGLAPQTTVRMSSADLMLEELELAAVAAYGEDWEERGRNELARRADHSEVTRVEPHFATIHETMLWMVM